MRVRITLQLERAVAIPINHQHYLTAVVYHFLETADADYARFLHGEGYAPDEDDHRRFKLFCFSPLRSSRRRIAHDVLWLGPGEAEWLVASPLERFLTEFATGLLSQSVLRVGASSFSIRSVETCPAPDLKDTTRFKCLSPIVAAVSESDGDKRWTRYLRPKDPDFSHRVRANLLAKHAALHSRAPDDDRFNLAFDHEYLRSHRGTKLIDYKGTQIVGAFCPFTLSSGRELMQIAYDCGLGEKNAGGFGMIEKIADRG